MSFNRMKYDNCQTSREQNENVSILGYILSPLRYEHTEKCRHELGIVGGTAVSHISGNMVDLESDLRGQTRYNSMCVSKQFSPSTDGWIRNDMTSPISTKLEHLPSCQMIGYKSVPLPPAMELNQCISRR